MNGIDYAKMSSDVLILSRLFNRIFMFELKSALGLGKKKHE